MTQEYRFSDSEIDGMFGDNTTEPVKLEKSSDSEGNGRTNTGETATDPSDARKRLEAEIAAVDSGNGSKTEGSGNGSKTEGSRKYRGLRRTSWRNKPALPHNYRVGNRVVVIGASQGPYETETPKIETPRYDSPRDYALLTFSLRSGSVRESINSLFRSLVRRVSETEHKALARLGRGLLVVKLDTKDGVVKGLYEPYESGLRERGSMLYEHNVIDEVTEDEEGFSGRLENILRGYRSPNRVVPIYVQNQLKPDLLTAINNLEIDPAIECDLGSFPREERKKY